MVPTDQDSGPHAPSCFPSIDSGYMAPFSSNRSVSFCGSVVPITPFLGSSLLQKRCCPIEIPVLSRPPPPPWIKASQETPMLHFPRSFILVHMGGSVSREFNDRVLACVQDEASLQEIFADHIFLSQCEGFLESLPSASRIAVQKIVQSTALPSARKLSKIKSRARASRRKPLSILLNLAASDITLPAGIDLEWWADLITNPSNRPSSECMIAHIYQELQRIEKRRCQDQIRQRIYAANLFDLHQSTNKGSKTIAATSFTVKNIDSTFQVLRNSGAVPVTCKEEELRSWIHCYLRFGQKMKIIAANNGGLGALLILPGLETTPHQWAYKITVKDFEEMLQHLQQIDIRKMVGDLGAHVIAEQISGSRHRFPADDDSEADGSLHEHQATNPETNSSRANSTAHDQEQCTNNLREDDSRSSVDESVHEPWKALTTTAQASMAQPALRGHSCRDSTIDMEFGTTTEISHSSYQLQRQPVITLCPEASSHDPSFPTPLVPDGCSATPSHQDDTAASQQSYEERQIHQSRCRTPNLMNFSKFPMATGDDPYSVPQPYPHSCSTPNIANILDYATFPTPTSDEAYNASSTSPQRYPTPNTPAFAAFQVALYNTPQNSGNSDSILNTGSYPGTFPVSTRTQDTYTIYNGANALAIPDRISYFLNVSET